MIREFFWVKNLVAKKRLGPIQKRLENNFDTTLAALVGSQLENARDLLTGLLPRLTKLNLPSVSALFASEEFNGSLSKLISDKDEETMLADMESGAFFEQTPKNKSEAETDSTVSKTEHAVPQLSAEHRDAIKKRLEPLVKQIAESKLHIAFNVAALLLNARDTNRSHKEQTVEAVISNCQILANFTNEIVAAIIENSKRAELISSWLP